jgi:hypothetical protein
VPWILGTNWWAPKLAARPFSQPHHLPRQPDGHVVGGITRQATRKATSGQGREKFRKSKKSKISLDAVACLPRFLYMYMAIRFPRGGMSGCLHTTYIHIIVHGLFSSMDGARAARPGLMGRKRDSILISTHVTPIKCAPVSIISSIPSLAHTAGRHLLILLLSVVPRARIHSTTWTTWVSCEHCRARLASRIQGSPRCAGDLV